MNQVYDIFLNDSNNDDKMYVRVKTNGIAHRFECDSGSKARIMNVDEFKGLKFNIPIKKTNVSFRIYTGHIFKPLGVAQLNISYQGNSSYEYLYIESIKKNAILRRDWIRKLNINFY